MRQFGWATRTRLFRNIIKTPLRLLFIGMTCILLPMKLKLEIKRQVPLEEGLRRTAAAIL